MKALEYSDEALNVRSAFLGVDSIVYVEGAEDIIFWEEIFKRVPDFVFQIEAVDGSGELDKYIEKIERGAIDAIAARDSDFLPHIPKLATSERVVYTKGYSIENTLYTDEMLRQLARSWCKSPNHSIADVRAWLQLIGDAFRQLVAMDIANAISNSGVAVLPDNCTKFMKSQKSPLPCEIKIGQHVAGVQNQIPNNVTASSMDLVLNSNAVLENLRGHTYVSAVIKYLVDAARVLGKTIHVASDSLYAAAIGFFQSLFGPDHPHFNHYIVKANLAVNSLK